MLRPSDGNPDSVVSALIKRLLVPLHQAWPRTKIIVRTDSDFCRARVLRRLERWSVGYVIGLQKNGRLQLEVELAELALADQYAARQATRCASIALCAAHRRVTSAAGPSSGVSVGIQGNI